MYDSVPLVVSYLACVLPDPYGQLVDVYLAADGCEAKARECALAFAAAGRANSEGMALAQTLFTAGKLVNAAGYRADVSENMITRDLFIIVLVQL